MIPLGSAPEAPTKEQLLTALSEPLKKMVAVDVRGDVDPEKSYQYRMARKYEYYDRGNQYLVPQMNGGQTVDWTPLGSLRSNEGQGKGSGRYDNVINILRGDKRKFVAVLGQRAPVVKCMPDRSDDEDATRLSRRADLEARRLYFDWDVQRKQRHLANALWKTSTTFGYTAFVTDASKYGTIEQPQYELQEQPVGQGSNHCMQCGADSPADAPGGTCPQCGAMLDPMSFTPAQTAQVPVQTGTKKYPKGGVEFTLATIFEVTTPFYARDVKDLPWLIYEYEEHNGRLLAVYGDKNPNLREKLMKGAAGTGNGSNASAIGTMARDTAASPSGTRMGTRRNRSLYARLWLEPLMYELVQEDPLRKLLTENFPRGCKLTMIGDDLVDIEDEKLVEHWSYCKPDVSEYIYADPICADFIGIQDLVNDMHNIEVETRERMIPWFLFDPQVLDPVQMRKHALLPGEGVPAKPGVGQQLSNSIWKAPVADPPQGSEEWVSNLINRGREMTGVLPAIFGAEGPSQTAREAELRRNQALMQLGVTWAEMRNFWEQCLEKGIRLRAKYVAAQGSEDQGAPEEQLAQLSELADGKWHCEAEEAMPMTWGQRRDLFMFLMDKQQTWPVFGIQDANNLPQVQEIFGMDNWTIPNLDARDKVYKTIQQLLKSSPIHNPSTGKVEPSIPIDVFEDDHMFSASVVKEWAQKEQSGLIHQTNPEGYSNVIAWAMAHLELTMPDPTMGPPPPDGGAPPEQHFGGSQYQDGPGKSFSHGSSDPHKPLPGGPPPGTAAAPPSQGLGSLAAA